MSNTIADPLAPEFASVDPFVADLLAEIRESGPIPSLLGRLCFRYTKLELYNNAVMVFQKIDPRSPLRSEIAMRLAAQLPPDLRNLVVRDYVVPSSESLSDGFSFALSSQVLAMAAIAAVFVWVPTLVARSVLDFQISAALTLVLSFATLSTMQLTWGQLVLHSSQRPLFAVLKHWFGSALESLRSRAPVLGLLFGPSLLVGLISPLTASILLVISASWFAISLPLQLANRSWESLTPKRLGRLKKKSSEDFFVLATTGSLLAFVAIVQLFSLALSVWSHLPATFAFYFVSAMLMRIAATTLNRIRHQHHS